MESNYQNDEINQVDAISDENNQTAVVEENECPCCFSKVDVADETCPTCGHNLKEKVNFELMQHKQTSSFVMKVVNACMALLCVIGGVLGKLLGNWGFAILGIGIGIVITFLVNFFVNAFFISKEMKLKEEHAENDVELESTQNNTEENDKLD